MQRYEGLLEDRRSLGKDCVLLRVRVGEASWRLGPAMFFMLRTPGPEFPLLSRPMSVCDYAHEPGRGWRLEFLLKIVGAGTRVLAAMEPGAALRLLGPLGRPFSIAREARRHVLVAGGIGIAPFPALLRELRELGVPRDRIELRFGARSRDDLVDLPRYEAAGIGIRLATLDGSRGLRGTVLTLLERDLAARALGSSDRLYACGPDPMLRALARFAVAKGIPGELSLEAAMACGFGVCHSCVVPVAGQGPAGEPYVYEKICTDGPVFAANRLWLGDHAPRDENERRS